MGLCATDSRKSETDKLIVVFLVFFMGFVDNKIEIENNTEISLNHKKDVTSLIRELLLDNRILN